MNKTDQNISPASTAHWTRNPGWWALIVSTCAFIFSGFALYLSYSDPSRQSAEAILEQSPNVLIDWSFKSIDIGGGTILPPYLSIRNVGPVAASQLRVFIFDWQIFLDSEAKSMGRNSNCEWVFSSLEPLNDTIIWISRSCTNPIKWPSAINVLEIRYEYRREIDLKGYMKREFAILAQDSVWHSIYSLPDDSLKQPILILLRNLPVGEPWMPDDAESVEIDD